MPLWVRKSVDVPLRVVRRNPLGRILFGTATGGGGGGGGPTYFILRESGGKILTESGGGILREN